MKITKNISVPTYIKVQIDNQIKLPDINYPVIVGIGDVLVDEQGLISSNVVHHERPIGSGEMVGDLLDVLNNKLQLLGLKIVVLDSLDNNINNKVDSNYYDSEIS